MEPETVPNPNSQADLDTNRRPEPATLDEEKNARHGHASFSFPVFLAMGLGLGYSPIAPGTLGAALGVGIYYLLRHIGALHITLPIVCVGLFAVGVVLSEIAERHFGEKDPGRIVIDEIASFPLTMLFISPTLSRIAIAFVLNRAADILKPFPAGRIQDVKGGWGVMLDDTIAAVYANLALRLLIVLFKF